MHSESIVGKFIIVGDRVLVKPRTSEQTKSGLFLPPGVQEKEKIQSGYVLKTGPGYAVAPPQDADEIWKQSAKSPQYIPLQATEGDLAIYLHNYAYEIEYEQEKYMIVPHSAILLLIREDDLT
ncbi:MAG: chaperonin [[Candidatus Thermochlorobacteriaceae] bacterium GBChlB]|jgi:co-chaperonin GroES (HSP10)|nr:MAG: chaperonin [[Candidatus Thermochlorobacteriaceae] bacterium GBChlB]